MSAARVWGYFYGGLINPDIMIKLGMKPERQEQACLAGFELTISPWVNLKPNPQAVSFGLLLYLTHGEIEHVYGQLKAKYVPFAVLAQTHSGKLRPALTYVVPEMVPGQADAEHVQNLLKPAEELGFPDWYLAKIRSFLPSAG